MAALTIASLLEQLTLPSQDARAEPLELLQSRGDRCGLRASAWLRTMPVLTSDVYEGLMRCGPKTRAALLQMAAAPGPHRAELRKAAAKTEPLREIDLQTPPANAAIELPAWSPLDPELAHWVMLLETPGDGGQHPAWRAIYALRKAEWIPRLGRIFRERLTELEFSNLARTLSHLARNCDSAEGRRQIVSFLRRRGLSDERLADVLTAAGEARVPEAARKAAWAVRHGDELLEAAGRWYFEETGSPAGVRVLRERLVEQWHDGAQLYASPLGRIGTAEAIAALGEAAERGHRGRGQGVRQSYYYTLLALAETRSAQALPVLVRHFARDPEFALEPLARALSYRPDCGYFDLAVQVLERVSASKAWRDDSHPYAPHRHVFVYLWRSHALQRAEIRAIVARWRTGFRQLKPELRTFLTLHYADLLPKRT